MEASTGRMISLMCLSLADELGLMISIFEDHLVSKIRCVDQDPTDWIKREAKDDQIMVRELCQLMR